METIAVLIQWINSNGWIVSIFTLVLGAYINAILTKNKEVLMKIADKKGQYYAEYINALLEFSRPVHQRVTQGSDYDINRQYYYLKNLVILYASNEVISKLAICEKSGIDTNTKLGKRNYLDLIEAMKKDIEKPRIIKVIGRGKSKEERKQNIADILKLDD